MRGRTVIGAVIGVLLTAVFAVPAAADLDPADADPEVAAMLAAVPGGVLVDTHTARWPALDMDFTVPRTLVVELGPLDLEVLNSVGPCATGRICAYSSPGLSGSALTFGSCGVLAVPATFTTRSLADARSSGYAQARNGTVVLATAVAGSWSNVPSGTTTNIRCFL